MERNGQAMAAKKGSATVSRTRSIVFVGLTIALMGVSAWVAIPFGPILLTLQMFALSFAILALSPRQCLAAVTGYLALGAIGLPMFSGMRGGIGMLLGPTGGYLWGYLLGAAIALLVRWGLRRLAGVGGSTAPDARAATRGAKAFAVDLAACLAFVAVSYVCGCLQYAAVVGVDLAASFAVTVVPFAVPDVLKAVAAVICARAVNRAVPQR